MRGRLGKLKIIAFRYAETPGTPVGNTPETGRGVFFAQVNPEKYSVNYQVRFHNEQEHGTQWQNPTFSGSSAREMRFEFLFDSTGALPDTNPLAEDDQVGGIGPIPQVPTTVAGQVISRAGVFSQIKYFESIVFAIQGETHEPNYLVINWGSLVFKCRLTSMDVTYKLFSPEGLPLRATVDATFQEIIEPREESHQTSPSSPDITHSRIVKAGDTLPMLAKQIYGDERYYVAVAKANELFDFRDLQPGQVIYFPPINRS